MKWHGLRVLDSELKRLRERGKPLRVITTTYMGATERRAIDELVTEYGAEVKISYETQATRLHAKAWLFRRNSGFDTAYVGSSNLSQAALLDGLEWNVRLSVGTPTLLEKFKVTFDSYWNDAHFPKLRSGTRRRKAWTPRWNATGQRGTAACGIPTGLEVQPYLHQEEMLEDLEVERTVHVGTTTSWSPRPAPARPSSPPWTTEACVRRRPRASRRALRRPPPGNPQAGHAHLP